jgi:cell division septal protein FtsQ
MHPKKSLMKWRKLSKALGSILLILAVVFWLKSDFWVVKKIDCQVNSGGCPPEIWTDLMSLSLGKNIIFFPRQDVIRKIKENHHKIASLKIKKRFPAELLFKLKERKPIVALAIEAPVETSPGEFSLTGDFYLTDEEGVIVEKGASSQDLPLILLKNDPRLAVGERFNQEEILRTNEILLKMKLRLIEPKLGRILSVGKVEIWLKDNVRVVMSSEKEIDSQLDSLQLILRRAKIEGEQIKEIDLRFDKPVIKP